MRVTIAKETQDTIRAWADAAFGESANLARVIARANEELAEGLRAITSDQPADVVALEVADTAIVLMRAADMAHMHYTRVDDAKITGVGDKRYCIHLFAEVGRDLLVAIEYAEHPSEFVLRGALRAAFVGLGDLSRRLGYGLWDRIDHKMAVNRARVWKRDGTGHGYHVREKAA